MAVKTPLPDDHFYFPSIMICDRDPPASPLPDLERK